MLNVRWEKIDLCIPEHFIWDHVGVPLCLSSAPGAATNPGAAQELTAGITHWTLGWRGKVSHPVEAVLALLQPSESQWFVTEEGHDLMGQGNAKCQGMQVLVLIPIPPR